jgi:phage-related protein
MSRKLRWLGSSLDDLRDMPAEVQSKTGFALREVQEGLKPDTAKPLKGYGGASVLEIIVDHDADTFRAVLHGSIRGGGVCVALLHEEIKARGQDA